MGIITTWHKEGKQEIDMEGDTPKAGETKTPEAPENGTQTQAPPQGNAGDSAVEKLRKEKEQAEMRANQLANKLKAKEDAEAAAEAKKLEEQNEFKTLYEQEKAKREAIESERKSEAERKELDKAKTEVLAGYSDEVKTLAEETGLSLESADEDAKTAFKEKLDKIQGVVGGTDRVTPDNPRRPSGKPELSQDELRVKLKDPQEFAKIIAQRPGLAAMQTKRQ